ncbi:MAG TPA: TonB-dependent receptor, partial [Bryobacteraceae bacterium]|nr:TonB-dependent receptor [Bryobacteraceae bacterium]
IDGGFDQSFARDRVRISATYFYTRLQETILFDFSGVINPVEDPFGRFGGYRNTNGGLSRGVEASAAVAATRSLDIRAAYTYTNARERTPLVDNILRSYLVPDNLFSLVATQRIGGRLTVSLTLLESSNYLAPVLDPVSFASRAYQFPGMKQAAVAANYRIPLSDTRAVRLFGKVSNLFDQTYYASGFRTAGILGLGGMQFEF